MEGGGEAPAKEIGPIFRDVRRYYCEFCGICRSKKTLIASHILSDHQDELKNRVTDEDGEKEVHKSVNVCEDCGVSFKKPAHLKQHLLSHSVERPFVCSVQDCQSSFRRKDHLNRHLLQHKGKLFKCLIEGCNKEFSVQGNIKRHVNDFHDEKREHKTVKEPEQHICKEIGCGKEFTCASRLQKHEESHVKLDSSEAFCSDPNCMKPFSNVQCLRAHVRSCHQYVICGVCSSKHLRKNIKRHLRTHEDHTPGTFKCNFEGCDHSFTTNSNLQQHVKAAHLNLRPFVCSVPDCGMRFAFKHVRDNHENTFRHVYAEGDLEEFDREFRSRPRGGRKRQYPTIESLMRKRITPLNRDSTANGSVEASDYLSWLLSGDDDNEE